MIKYDVTKIQKLFETHEITEFDVKDVHEDDEGIHIYVKQKNTLASYLQTNCRKYLKFKNNDDTYEVQPFFINVEGTVRMVFVIKKEASIVHVLSMYEINKHEEFINMYADLVIDEIIEED